MKTKQIYLMPSPDLPSLNKKVNPYKACIYVLCRDFFVGVGYDLGTKFYCRNGEPFTLTMMIYLVSAD